MTTVTPLTAAPLSPEERARLIAIVRERSFRTGTFTLASGRESTLYFNLKPTLMQPEGSYLAARGLLALAVEARPDFAGGLEMGAVPILGAIAALSHLAGRPVATFFVRKKPKDHGTRLAIEGLKDGETLSGKRVLMVDDVTTTGGSTVKAIEAARQEGAIVDAAVSLLDREEGAVENLAAIGVRLRSVLRAGDFG
ncbi:MAG: orotate phosphoribosyltransferase [Bauldia sp.]|jgi:orotate phosphoribosyltransferase